MKKKRVGPLDKVTTDRMEIMLKDMQDELYYGAYKVANYFHVEHAAKSTKTEFGYLGCRVKLGQVGIIIEWYNQKHFKDGGNKNKLFSKHIARGRGDMYNLDKIKDHFRRREWEKELIDICEPQFAAYRKKSRQLVTLGRHMRQIQKVWDLEKRETSSTD